MGRRCGALRLLPLIVLWPLLVDAGAIGVQAIYAQKSRMLLAAKVECNASSPAVQAGQSVTLTAEVQGASTRLVYSFSSSSGRLYPNGRTARLDTAGVPAGTVITATCQTVDGLGRRSSGDVAVRVVGATASQAAQAVAAQRPPTAADQVAADWKKQASMSSAQATSTKSTEAWSDSVIRDSDSRSQTAAKRAMSGANAADQHAQDASNHAAQAAPSLDKERPSTSVAGSASESSAEPSRAPASVAAAGAPTPSPTPSPTAAPTPGPSAAAGGGNAYQQAEQVQQWKNQLKNGKIDYLIPPQMKLHETAVVKVVVHGFADTAAKSMAGATTGTLKVSPRMQVQLSAEDNPDEFEIEPKVGQIQFVPIDGSVTWMWKVTPKQPAENQTLTIRALLVYPDNGQQIEQEITSYTAQISVSVPGFWASLREAFWNDPTAMVKYVLPGGAGFTALAGLVVWWWKRRHPSPAKPGKADD